MRVYPLLFVGLLVTYSSVAQQADLAEAVQDVLVKDDTYEQSFTYDAANNCLLTFTIVDTDDGEETVYQVNAADLNEHKVRFDTKSNSVMVEAETRGGKDLVRVFEDGEVDGFDESFEIYAAGIENARAIVKALKEIIVSCNSAGKEVLISGKANPTFNEALNFLSAEIGEITVGQEEFNQSFSYDSEQPTVITYTWEDPSEGESRKYVANVADFNEQGVSFNTKGGNVWLTLVTQGERDLIQTYEDGELDDYESEIQLMAADIEQARVLEKALKSLIATAADRTQDSFIPGNAQPDRDATTRYLTEQVGDVVLSDDVYEQTFFYDPDVQQLTYEVTDMSKGDKDTFRVNPADLNVNTIRVDTKGSAVLIQLETQGERDLIQVSENDVVDGYDNEITMRAPGVDAGRDWVEALKRLVLLGRANQNDAFSSLGSNLSQSETLKFLQENIHRVEAGEDSYQQTFATASGNQCLITYTAFDEDEGEEEVYEWNMADINANPIAFDTKGEEILITLATTGDRKLIKVIEDGEVDGYEDEVELRANDIEEARALVSAFKRLADLCDK